MFKKFLEYIKYRKNLKELKNNYIAVFCIYNGVQLCDPHRDLQKRTEN